MTSKTTLGSGLVVVVGGGGGGSGGGGEVVDAEVLALLVPLLEEVVHPV